ncbi:MAG: hypothetical protein K2I70_06265 [Bacilli bacterium]|nr:hypothetical protein [Bacilli bacterium]
MNNQSLKDNPRVLTLSAIILGYALISDYSANEQNAIGNWFMLVGQILETNAAFEQNNQNNPSNNNQIFAHRLSANEAEIQKIKEVLENLIDKINNL